MEALAGINGRILQIQSRLAELSAYAVHAQGLVLSAPAGVLGSAGVRAPSSAMAFDAVLEQAMATTTGVGSGVDLVDAKGLPTELLAYGNGKVPVDALSSISGTSHSLWAPAARSFEAMRDAAARDGAIVGITDSYRSYANQVDVAARKGLYSQGGLAAAPGTSNHGWGIALDLKLDAGAQAWMRTNGGTYGFVEDVAREPWHWTYRPVR